MRSIKKFLPLGFTLLLAATVLAAVSRDSSWDHRVSINNLHPDKIVALKDITSQEWTETPVGKCYLSTYGKTIRAGTVLTRVETEGAEVGQTSSGTVFTSKILAGTKSGYVLLACRNKDHYVQPEQFIQSFSRYFAFTFTR